MKQEVETQVKKFLPSAQLIGGHHGKVWIDDGTGRIIGSVQAIGTREYRRENAWKTALMELEGQPGEGSL